MGSSLSSSPQASVRGMFLNHRAHLSPQVSQSISHMHASEGQPCTHECVACRSAGQVNVSSQEAYKVVNAKLLQLQHDGAQVGAQNLRIGLLLQVPAEGRLCVQPEALPRLGAPGAPCPLVSARLRSWVLALSPLTQLLLVRQAVVLPSSEVLAANARQEMSMHRSIIYMGWQEDVC